MVDDALAEIAALRYIHYRDYSFELIFIMKMTNFNTLNMAGG